MNSLAEELRGHYARPKGIPRLITQLTPEDDARAALNLRNKERIAKKEEREDEAHQLYTAGKMNRKDIAERMDIPLAMVSRYILGFLRRTNAR